MDPMEQIKATFFLECEELLADLESGLLAMEAGESDDDTVNAVFRAVHSIKGGAGAFGLESLVRFAHVFETTLDEMRSGRVQANDLVLKIMLRAADMLADHVSAAKAGGPTDEALSAALAEELSGLCEGGVARAGEPGLNGEEDDFLADLDFTPQMVMVGDDETAAPAGQAPEAVGEPAGAMRAWRITFRPKSTLYAKANDSLLLLRELARLGDCRVELDASGLPSLEEMDPEEAYLTWTAWLATERAEADIRDVFEFVEGDCELTVEIESGAAEPEAAIVEEPAAEVDMDVLALIQRATEQAEAMAADPETAGRAESGPAPALPAEAKTAAPAANSGNASVQGSGATIRVDLDRVDRLINLVGELVINQAMLAQRVFEAGLARSSTVAMGLEDLELLTREIQDSVMAIRAQPVKSVFQRMPRLVREVAAMTGKLVRLVTDGEATEVDKTVIERLSDPITHMIRNAIDHGLENPEQRRAVGKPSEGVVRLSAQHRSGRIVIEVSDDGAGINRERVKKIAADKGLIDPAAQLSDEEVDNLIFLPGFSTAATISDVSGRGVGMDVVKRSIQALGGRISIASRPGEGSTFTLSLPLTLAVLDGMVVTVEGQTLVVPLTAIIETLKPKSHETKSLGPQSAVLAVRDSYTPLIDVGTALGYRVDPLDPLQGVALLVDSDIGGRAALMVDAIQGQRQVVIKSLEANYEQVDGVAAATILGDGRVALILDVDAVVGSGRRGATRPEPAPLLKAAS
jgi:two-component system chemotaxis sensor kinase CheA